LPSSPGSQLICDEGGKTRFPLSDGLMRELEASFQKHFGKITQAQCIAEPPEDDQEHDSGGIVEEVERGSRPFVEDASAVGATECPIAQRRFLGLFLGGR